MPTAELSAVGICLPSERLRMHEPEEENRVRLPPDVAKTKDGGLTSTQDVAYTDDNTMARLHGETIPSSTLAASARVVDGFVSAQTDHQGITGSFTRAGTALGKVKDIILCRLRMCGFRCQRWGTGTAGFVSESYSMSAMG